MSQAREVGVEIKDKCWKFSQQRERCFIHSSKWASEVYCNECIKSPSVCLCVSLPVCVQMQEVRKRGLMQMKLVIHLTLTFNHLCQSNHWQNNSLLRLASCWVTLPLSLAQLHLNKPHAPSRLVLLLLHFRLIYPWDMIKLSRRRNASVVWILPSPCVMKSCPADSQSSSIALIQFTPGARDANVSLAKTSDNFCLMFVQQYVLKECRARVSFENVT